MTRTSKDSLFLDIISISGAPSLHRLEITKESEVFQISSDGGRIVPSIDSIILIDLKNLCIYNNEWYIKNSKDDDIFIDGSIILKEKLHPIKNKQIIEIKQYKLEISFSLNLRVEETGPQTLTELLIKPNHYEELKITENPFDVIDQSFSASVQQRDNDIDDKDILKKLEQEYQQVIVTPEKLDTSYNNIQIGFSINKNNSDPFEDGSQLVKTPIHDIISGKMTIKDVEHSLEGLNGEELYAEEDPVDVLMLFAPEQIINQKNKQHILPQVIQKDHRYNSLNAPMSLGETFIVSSETGLSRTEKKT